MSHVRETVHKCTKRKNKGRACIINMDGLAARGKEPLREEESSSAGTDGAEDFLFFGSGHRFSKVSKRVPV